MAGGKETPRQKLIGLMYLVLLAMLALQVSASIMVKFESLWQSMRATVENAHERNHLMFQAIEKEATGKGTTADKKEVFEKAQEFSKKSDEIHNYLSGIERTLIEMNDGYREEVEGDIKPLKNPGNEDKVAAYMVTADKKGEEMKDKLNSYVSYLNTMVKWINDRRKGNNPVNLSFSPIALDGKDDPIARNDDHNRVKDFASLNFEHVPLVAALATIEDKAAAITSMEAAIYKELAEEVNATPITITGFNPVVAASSQSVVPGQELTADIMLVPSTAQKLEVLVNGKPVPVEGGVGKFSQTIAGEPGAKSLNIEILQKRRNGDTTYKVKQEYEVLEGGINISSAVLALYEQCKNPLNVTSCALGTGYDPAYSVQNGGIIRGSKPEEVVIIPKESGKNCILTVNHATKKFFIGKQEFPVKPVPFPSVNLYPGRGGKINLNSKTCMPAALPSLIIHIEPDQGFASALPSEAKYVIADGDITAAKGAKGLGSFSLRGAKLRLADEAKYGKNAYIVNIPPGLRGSVDNKSRYIVNVAKIQRISSDGKRIPVKMRPVMQDACLQ